MNKLVDFCLGHRDNIERAINDKLEDSDTPKTGGGSSQHAFVSDPTCQKAIKRVMPVGPVYVEYGPKVCGKSGVVVNGNLVYGHDGFAGEIGHLKICRDKNARVCGCGNKGCIETYASAPGLVRTTKEYLMSRTDDSLLRELNIDEINSKDVYEAALKGDALAKEIFDYTGRLLGAVLADFACSTSPEAYIIYGGLSKAGDILLKPVIESMEENLIPSWRGKIKVIVSQLNSSDAPVLGASALGWKAE